jgi:hypothetical protein
MKAKTTLLGHLFADKQVANVQSDQNKTETMFRLGNF